jgi:hypothetical protein
MYKTYRFLHLYKQHYSYRVYYTPFKIDITNLLGYKDSLNNKGKYYRKVGLIYSLNKLQLYTLYI